MASRKFDNWIQAFIDATDKTSTPTIFRKWSAISCLAGVLERRVWVFTAGSKLYPNLYIVLVARPGIGKTEATDRVRMLWDGVEGVHIASSNLSRASLADELNSAKRLDKTGEYNALNASVNELGTLIPKYSADFMSQLTDLYDCKVYTERKRGNKLVIKIPNPFLNMIMATQPAYLQSFLPDTAWDQGFLSRCVLVYAPEQSQLQDLFDVPTINLKALAKDLTAIQQIKGCFQFTEEARNFINQWYVSGGKPRPDHPKLVNYCTRRTAHLLKLCQIAAINTKSVLNIGLETVQVALGWLLEAESNLDDIFKVMGERGGDSSLISDTWHFARKKYAQNHKPIPKNLLYAFLASRTDAYKVEHIIRAMENSGYLKRQGLAYVPKAIANVEEL